MILHTDRVQWTDPKYYDPVKDFQKMLNSLNDTDRATVFDLFGITPNERRSEGSASYQVIGKTDDKKI